MIGATLSLIVGLIMMVAANVVLGPPIAAGRISTAEEQEMGLFPSGTALGPASCGFRNLVADLLWLRALQYYGMHRQGDMVFDKAEHVFTVLTDLDPGFTEAYRFGSLVLLEDAAAGGAGFQLLRKGIRNNPHDGSLYFDLGFHHFMVKEYGRAAVYFEKASELPGGGDKASRFAAYAQNQSGRLDVAEEMWLEILESTSNEKTRATAEFALRGIAVSRDTTFLAERCRTFYSRYKLYPGSPHDLIAAGLIRKMPEDPFGSYYVLQPLTGEVRSWHLLSRELKRDCIVLEKIIDRYAEERRAVPDDLAMLQREGYLKTIPSPFGVTYQLNRETGKVDVLFPRVKGRRGS